MSPVDGERGGERTAPQAVPPEEALDLRVYGARTLSLDRLRSWGTETKETGRKRENGQALGPKVRSRGRMRCKGGPRHYEPLPRSPRREDAAAREGGRGEGRARQDGSGVGGARRARQDGSGARRAGRSEGGRAGAEARAAWK